MPIPYKKPYNQSGRSYSGGPRDHQLRQLYDSVIDKSQADLVESLREQIELLKNQPGTKSLTNEQINEEIIEAVKEETVKYRESIKNLELENGQLKDSLHNKDILIEQFKRISGPSTKIESKSDRPRMEEAFIDPIEKEFNGIETHINTEDTVSISKKDLDGKVDKLKKLLGKT